MVDIRYMHSFSIRIYYEDTDAGGVVYYSNYLRFAERARTEFLRELGFNHNRLLNEEGILVAVKRCETEYLKPARLDDALEIRTRLLNVTGARFLLEQSVERAEDTLVQLRTSLACIRVNGRPCRVPVALSTALKGFAGPVKKTTNYMDN